MGKSTDNAGRAVREVYIAGTGSYLPEQILTNAELAKRVDTSDEWIRTRTGIRERRIAGPDEPTSAMAAKAAERALEASGLSAGDLDLIIVGTITPDMVFPSTACVVQNILGADKAFCFDLEAACSGFLYGIEVARNFIAAGGAEKVLVIGAEKLSCITDWEDRSTCVLFGDGAGAAVLAAREKGRGIVKGMMGSDGALADLLMIPAGGSRQPVTPDVLEQRDHYLKMQGREVFKHAVLCMTDAAQQALERSGMTVDDVDCIIPHQANMRIMHAVASRLGTGVERFYLNVDRYGNMSAASAAVALDEASRQGVIKRGDIVLMVVFGGGFTWGALVLEW